MDTQLGDKLCIVSYNSTGLSDNKMNYINHMLDKYNIDILLLQETWLTPLCLGKLTNIHKDYMAHGISGIPRDEILRGRPYGGVAI